VGPRGGLWLMALSLCVMHKEGLCPSSGGINRLMMMMIKMPVPQEWRPYWVDDDDDE
jgi:hypothetical protein